MSETTETTTDETAGETSADTSTEIGEATATVGESTDGEKALGDAGKKALDAMKAKLSKATEELAELRAVNGDKRGIESLRTRARQEVEDKIRELEEFKAKAEGREAEFQKAQEKREAEQAALAKANDRIRRSEVKAAAKGVLADPADAYKFLDLDQFEVDNDGNVDEGAIATALDALVKEKPYLAVQDSKRFKGDPDAGTRKESRPAQLSKEDVERLSREGKHDEIVKAKAEGRLADYLAS